MRLERNSNNLVSYSRAGDAFHYRWAARRCLKLIQANSSLDLIVVEGSSELNKAGEYAIDVSEYYKLPNSERRIDYYQLKHTTVQSDKPFVMSHLKDTLAEFSKRFSQHKKEESATRFTFTILTNRKISDSFRVNLNAIKGGDDPERKFRNTLEKYTNLVGDELLHFCNLLNLEDSEGDYNSQKDELKFEIAQILSGSIDNALIENLVSLVGSKCLPDQNGEIVKEDVLKRLGIPSERKLFPAPSMFEGIDNITIRGAYTELIDCISKANNPVIIEAEGGVGKSVFCQYLIKSLSNGSIGIAYDCFGSGKYRSRSEIRHGHRVALVQIANELASLGLCERMYVPDTTHDRDIMRDFLNRIEMSVRSLRQTINSANLFILIDAADNAEMAAQQFGDSCFANEMLKEEFPHGCKLVLLCRPERTNLLKPPTFISRFKLPSFSRDETLANLKKWFPNATQNDGFEFHRLTNGNPRVQMNSILAGHSSVNDLLTYLGPSGTTVEKQLEQQLLRAVQKIKDNLPDSFQINITRICTGLASLPPNIPIQILSRISEVRDEDISSFVADIGRSLRLLDSSVQFRDEPTETWFRNTFLGSKEDFKKYIDRLEPLAHEFTYIAEVLPQLYLDADQYDHLIKIALSDDFLPQSNPIDTRNVRVYRLQFAFKAALRSNNYMDAIKLSMRAGEEVAGDQRQKSLFQNNIDLLPLLQDKNKVQEIAFKGVLKSKWAGSENIFSASLLSGIEDFKGEAGGYLRSSLRWLKIYFDEERGKKDRDDGEGVDLDDILEIAIVQLNLSGAKLCLNFLNRLGPKKAIFSVMKKLAHRLIDAGRFDEIDEFLKYSRKNTYHVVALTSELSKVGRFAGAVDIGNCLHSLSSRKNIEKPDYYSEYDNIVPSILAFLEVCVHRGLESGKILEVLDYYIPFEASQGVGNRYNSKERKIFLQALSIRTVISKNSTINFDEIVPKVYLSKDRQRDYADDIKGFKEVVGSLLPWFQLRAQVIAGDINNLMSRAEQAKDYSQKAQGTRYRSYDTIPNEIAEVSASILVCCQADTKVVGEYYHTYLQSNSSFKIPARIQTLRAAIRLTYLSPIMLELENSIYILLKGLKSEGPDEIANEYISLARAVLFNSKQDAIAYFEEAIEVISKFGDEIVERWEAVVALGEQSVQNPADELAYRFIRCAELVGEYNREKHWDRSGALRTCIRMSPHVGISALSRWRDREIGRFDNQLVALLDELLRLKLISPAVGWSFARFFSDHKLNHFLPSCLENEDSEQVKRQILNDSFELLRREGAREDYWNELKSIFDKHQEENKNLEDTINFYKEHSRKPQPSGGKAMQPVEVNAEVQKEKFGEFFFELDITTPEGLSILIKRFSSYDAKNDSKNLRKTDILLECFSRISDNKVYDFLTVVIDSKELSHYVCQEVLSSIPNEWRAKIGFKRKWPEIIRHFGQSHAYELVQSYSFRTAVRELGIDGNLTDELKKGIFNGLANGNEFANARVFFAFVRLAGDFIKSNEAAELTDFALSRFELHIEKNFGDGPWSDWLQVPNDINKSIAGFIWSALGSPRSKVRWQACHTVKKLADFNCTQVLDCLIEWLEHDKVDAFGSDQFPFYKLHARQYLLIALSRISIDQAAVLLKYKKIFWKYSQSEPHILIQKLSADIALNIEKVISGTYSSAEIFSFNAVGKSKHEARKEEYGYRVDSYLHQRGEIDPKVKYHFAYDFDRYWFEPLGDVFGVASKQIEELCANVVINEWKHDKAPGYNNDPRLNLWNNSSDRETWYRKSDYPKTDNLDFYMSYHSMLVVAAKLVENMPVISSRDYWDEDDAWDYWLSRHYLTRMDGKWIADNRCELPLQRPNWISSENTDELWRTDIQEQDFLESIKIQHGEETWLNLKGGWTERHNSRYETYSVSGSLVSKTTSAALMRALATTSGYHDYKLPDFEEGGVEIDSGIFKLYGFILNPDVTKGIDEFDPYGGNISYPPFSFGEPFNKELDLLRGPDGKIWYFGDGQIALKCDTWSSNLPGYDEEPDQSGRRLSASLSLIKKLCQIFDSHLIIDVSISRDIEYKYRSSKEEYKYLTHHKIFLFTPDGRLRSTSKNYRLR